ncbi:MAG: cytochrome C [Betaproteobacteria bacterium]|nr:MAG: cytochrome C [Betaproteobacteria bacterium]
MPNSSAGSTKARTTFIALLTAVFFALFAQITFAQVGDAERGKRAWRAECRSCHTVDQNYLGPKHRGVLGRRVGKIKGFNFSPALSKSTLVWDAELLNRWLADPEQVVKGQWMGYRIDSAQTRADLVAYLATLK